MLLKKRGELINQFSKNNIISKNEKFYDVPKNMPDLESEESAAERRKQKGQGFKILTPNQILSRLLISLAQLKAGNNSEKLRKLNWKLKLYNYYILCTDQKNLQKMSLIIWSTLFKNENNLYEHWKQ